METTPSLRRIVIRQKAHWLTFWLAVALLVIGWVGTIVTTNGGWANVLTGKMSANWTLIGIIIQFILTTVQWVQGNNRYATYPTRALDAALNAYSYGSLVWYDLTRVFADNGIGFWYALFCSFYIIAVWSVFVAWYPEYRLVKD